MNKFLRMFILNYSPTETLKLSLVFNNFLAALFWSSLYKNFLVESCSFSLSLAILFLKLFDGFLNFLLLFLVLFLNPVEFLQFSFKLLVFLLDFFHFYSLGLINVWDLIQTHRKNCFQSHKRFERHVSDVLLLYAHWAQLFCELP